MAAIWKVSNTARHRTLKCKWKGPTALLQDTNALNGEPQTLKRALILSNLPAGVRNIITGQEFADLEKLAKAACRVWEARSTDIQQIAHAAHQPSPVAVTSKAKLESQNSRLEGPGTTPTPHLIFFTTSYSARMHAIANMDVTLHPFFRN